MGQIENLCDEMKRVEIIIEKYGISNNLKPDAAAEELMTFLKMRESIRSIWLEHCGKEQ